MKYFFVFVAIAVVWTAILAIALLVPENHGFTLFLSAQILTVVLFYIGFYRK